MRSGQRQTKWDNQAQVCLDMMVLMVVRQGEAGLNKQWPKKANDSQESQRRPPGSSPLGKIVLVVIRQGGWAA
jgi:hypothetical protein